MGCNEAGSGATHSESYLEIPAEKTNENNAWMKFLNPEPVIRAGDIDLFGIAGRNSGLAL